MFLHDNDKMKIYSAIIVTFLIMFPFEPGGLLIARLRRKKYIVWYQSKYG